MVTEGTEVQGSIPREAKERLKDQKEMINCVNVNMYLGLVLPWPY